MQFSFSTFSSKRLCQYVLLNVLCHLIGKNLLNRAHLKKWSCLNWYKKWSKIISTSKSSLNIRSKCFSALVVLTTRHGKCQNGYTGNTFENKILPESVYNTTKVGAQPNWVNYLIGLKVSPLVNVNWLFYLELIYTVSV